MRAVHVNSTLAIVTFQIKSTSFQTFI